LLADSHNILNRWKKYFSQLLNVHRVSDVRQIEIHTAEPLVPDPTSFEVEIVFTTGINFIQNVIKYSSLQVKSIHRWWIISVGFDVTDQLLIRSFAFVRYWKKNGSTMRQDSSYL
jgi:hypothetical protein